MGSSPHPGCIMIYSYHWKRPRAKQLALPTLDHGVAGSNPARGEILPEPKRRFIAQSLSCSPFHCLEMTEILLKGRKTLTHPYSYQQVYQALNSKPYWSNIQVVPLLGCCSDAPWSPGNRLVISGNQTFFQLHFWVQSKLEIFLEKFAALLQHFVT